MFAGQFVKWGIQLARLELLARLDLLSAFPPVGAGVRKHILLRLFRRTLLRAFLALIFEF
jgi:hypothetical protein